MLKKWKKKLQIITFEIVWYVSSENHAIDPQRVGTFDRIKQFACLAYSAVMHTDVVFVN